MSFVGHCEFDLVREGIPGRQVLQLKIKPYCPLPRDMLASLFENQAVAENLRVILMLQREDATPLGSTDDSSSGSNSDSSG
jgi:hypothetical protein